ncbi:substrate-binding periplasmic protein [Agaribacter marinus]|nr:transporter substrate-binding domain-containing protein [Agaribacter marinus]
MKTYVIGKCFSFFLMLGFWGLAEAKTLVLSSDDGPPHMIKESSSGIDIDITREILQALGYDVSVRFSSLARGKSDVELGNVDAVTPTFFEKDREGFYVSKPIVDYRPTVFTLKHENHKIGHILDLIGHRVVTFQGAKGYFGSDFVKVSKNTVYKEHYDMGIFPDLLKRGRYSVVVVDYYIFYYFYRLKDKNRDASLFQTHSVIPPVKAGVGFHDKKLRDRFNAKLAEYTEQGRHLLVIEKYIGKVQ